MEDIRARDGLDEIAYLKGKAKEIRTLSIKMIYNAKSGHSGGSLSEADILAVLYFKELNVDPTNPDKEDRDRFVLSKGHGAPGLYAALAMRGFFSEEMLSGFRQIGSMLQGHVTRGIPGVEMTTGSLGQGICTAIGMAIAGKIDKKDYKVYVVLGDGEMDEGSVWEAAIAAAHYSLSNLIVILDRNMLQLEGGTEDIMKLGDVEAKWRAFGWNVASIDGHDIKEIIGAIEQAKSEKQRPSIIIARTVKGKGVSYMEGVASYHGKAPQSDEDYRKALDEIGCG
jgi:transketolase